MGWTAPATVVAGQLMTAAFWNTQVRDNMRFLREQAWPVGSIFSSGVSTDPATLLGFGTWAAFGPGRTMVGVDPAQAEFVTATLFGGEKSHVLTLAELPAHAHGYNRLQWTIARLAFLDLVEAGNFSSPTADTSDTGGGGAHNNLMPYIVCYQWRRTA